MDSPEGNPQNWSSILYDSEESSPLLNITLEDSFHDAKLYVVIGLLSFLSILGTIGNSVVIYVFLRKRDRLVSTHFILVLAFVDLTTCVVVIPYTITMEYIHYKVNYDLLCKIYQFLITSNIPFSALIMVAIAIDRYLCICHPFIRALNIPRAKVMTVCLAVFSFTIGVIVALMFGVYGRLEKQEYLEKYGSLEDVIFGQESSANSSVNSVSVFNSRPSILQNNISIEQNETDNATEYKKEYIIIYSGYCANNTLIFNESFQFFYQKVYTAMYLLCLIIVVVLYTLIYKSVLDRRSRRQRQKSQVLYLVPTACEDMTLTTAANENHAPETSLTVKMPQEHSNGGTPCRERPPSKTKPGRRKSTKRDKMMRMANLKTAGMLFVVTVVFIVTFLPAFLMTNHLIPYNIIVFYMYFANNVANPVIYSFMNKNFRDDLHKIFCA